MNRATRRGAAAPTEATTRGSTGADSSSRGLGAWRTSTKSAAMTRAAPSAMGTLWATRKVSAQPR